MLTRSLIATAALSLASAAAAQWVPGSELVGLRATVQTDGITNIVEFQRDGVARISSPTGATVVNANWTADGRQLCLKTATASDCYAYSEPFRRDQTLDLVSNCGIRSRWSVRFPVGERG
jgi:hypothetical protein